MSRYRRGSLGGQSAYTPGEQPPDDDGWLKLNTNEAPVPPSPAVLGAVSSAAAELRRYPDPCGEPLRSALAAHHHVDPEQILIGNGADDVLDCCFRAFCDPGDNVVLPLPTYSLLPVLARQHGAALVELPLDEDSALPANLGTAPGVLRFVVNPNAPTGLWLEPEALERLLRPCQGVVVIDEAYCDFAPASSVPLLGAHDNWLVVRTFSKSHALAGLRVGYAIGNASLIADLYGVKASYPVGRCAIAGARAALRDGNHHARLVAEVRRERLRLAAGLEELGWRVLPSEANFVFARPADGNAATIVERLRSRRILVRRFADDPHYSEWIRISIGGGEEMDRVTAALRSS